MQKFNSLMEIWLPDAYYLLTFQNEGERKQSWGNADKKAHDTDSRDSIFNIMTRVKKYHLAFRFEYFECHSKNNLFNETVYSPSHRPNPVSVN